MRRYGFISILAVVLALPILWDQSASAQRLGQSSATVRCVRAPCRPPVHTTGQGPVAAAAAAARAKAAAAARAAAMAKARDADRAIHERAAAVQRAMRKKAAAATAGRVEQKAKKKKLFGISF